MPKFRNILTDETKELADFVVKMAPAIIVDGKKIPNGGWVPVAKVGKSAQEVLDKTKPASKTEKAEATKTAKAKASEATDLLATIGDAKTIEDYNATLEAAKTALTEAAKASAISNAKAASTAVDKATKALEEVAEFVAEDPDGEDDDEDDDDLLGTLKQ